MNPETVPRSRKSITKKLSTGQKITLTPQDDRTLKNIYDYMAGFAKRKSIENLIEAKRKEVAEINSEIPTSAKIMLQQKGINYQEYQPPSSPGGNSIESESEVVKSETDIKIDRYYQAKAQLNKLEEKLKTYNLTDHKICFKDLDGVLRSLNTVLHKRQIEQMIWEVDENLDDLIDYDELQLTYYRNLTDSTNNEPNTFFRLLEFTIFDGAHKGYMIEDDCMELLYARYGGGNLEKEMRLLFGKNLRAEGGDGSLNLVCYLESQLARKGRRSLVC